MLPPEAPVHRTRIKICGVTRAQDALAAAHAGADAVGLVFHAPSPRHVSMAQAAEIARVLPPFVTLVGLFVNPLAAEVNDTLRQVPLQLLQFHGDESPEFCASFGRPWIKAARMASGFDVTAYATRFAQAGARALVLDAYHEAYGGAGVAFDWSLIPPQLPLPLILAGGLNAENVAQAVAAVAPWAVDVSSGVEPAHGPKGTKDTSLIQQFVAQTFAGGRHASL